MADEPVSDRGHEHEFDDGRHAPAAFDVVIAAQRRVRDDRGAHEFEIRAERFPRGFVLREREPREQTRVAAFVEHREHRGDRAIDRHARAFVAGKDARDFDREARGDALRELTLQFGDASEVIEYVRMADARTRGDFG